MKKIILFIVLFLNILVADWINDVNYCCAEGAIFDISTYHPVSHDWQSEDTPTSTVCSGEGIGSRYTHHAENATALDTWTITCHCPDNQIVEDGICVEKCDEESTSPASPPEFPSGWDVLGSSELDCLTNSSSGNFEINEICSNLIEHSGDSWSDAGVDRKVWKTIWAIGCCGLNNHCIVLKPSTSNPNGRCTSPSIEIDANNELECMNRDASNLIWNTDNDIPYCCGEPNAPTCPVDYTNVSNVDGSTPTSAECSAHAGDLADNYSSVLTEYLTNNNSSLCCIKASNPTSDNNDSDNGDGSDNNETDNNDDNNDGENDNNDSNNNNDDDSNSTNPDLSSLEGKLDKINEDNNLNSKKNHDDLKSIDDKLDKINQDNNLNSNAQINNANNISDKAHQDAKDIKDAIIEGNQINSQFYREIKAIMGNTTMESPTPDLNSSNPLDSNSSDGIDLGYLDGLLEFKDMISTSLNNADTMFNDVKATINGDIPYSFAKGNTCVYHFQFRTFEKDVNLCSFGSYLRPFVILLLSINMLYYLVSLNLWLYFKVFGTRI